MKRLAAICVLLAAIVLSAPSYGYVLVYNVSGTLRAVDTQTNNWDRTMVQGLLVADVEEGIVVGTDVVLYGRDEEGNRVYIESDAVTMTLYGDSAAVVGDVGQGGSMVLTGGRMRGRNRGRDIASNVPSMLDGDIRVIGGTLFDADQTLTGAGDLSATLDSMQTRNANRTGQTLDDVINGIIMRLEARGYVDIGAGEEEPPPGDEEPPLPS
jgi:hypothetical protein